MSFYDVYRVSVAELEHEAQIGSWEVDALDGDGGRSRELQITLPDVVISVRERETPERGRFIDYRSYEGHVRWTVGVYCLALAAPLLIVRWLVEFLSKQFVTRWSRRRARRGFEVILKDSDPL